jgi:hypothetical protein
MRDLFDDDFEALAERLDETAQSSSARIPADSVRTRKMFARPDDRATGR